MRWLPPALLAALMAGCGNPGPEQAFDTYLSRLERPLGTAAPPWEREPVPRPPRAAKLHIPLAPGRLAALDFLALRGCELQVTVGKRNSSLGRLAPPSQELLLELEFLRLAPACIKYLKEEDQETLASALSAALDSKRRELPSRIYNATLATDEFRSLWQAPQALGDYPESTSSAPLSALDGINALASRWLSGDYSANNRDFEMLLSDVARGDAGSLLAALNLQKAALEGANAMLREHRDGGGFCQGKLLSPDLDIFKNVVEKFFIRGIQPWSAALSQRLHGLLPPVRQLETQLSAVLPPAYREWRRQRENVLDTVSDAPRQHVQQVQQTLESCRTQSPETPLKTAASQRRQAANEWAASTSAGTSASGACCG
ncbi:DUF3080 family protein [Chromatocurvus halotolerans]|uniref:DUF3080 family protein n=3 Tax=Chromatocurvus halotolerans TaxID=1132028 RepID=A0A4R2L0C0_9GAMM|nr:DUF3080 family protein [Chromatocurvus halotolerans]